MGLEQIITLVSFIKKTDCRRRGFCRGRQRSLRVPPKSQDAGGRKPEAMTPISRVPVRLVRARWIVPCPQVTAVRSYPCACRQAADACNVTTYSHGSRLILCYGFEAPEI